MITSATGPPLSSHHRHGGGGGRSRRTTRSSPSSGGFSGVGTGGVAGSKRNRMRSRMAVIGAAAFCFIAFSVIPILLIEQKSFKGNSSRIKGSSSGGLSNSASVSVHKLFDVANSIRKSPILPILQSKNMSSAAQAQRQKEAQQHHVDPHQQLAKAPDHEADHGAEHNDNEKNTDKKDGKKDENKKKKTDKKKSITLSREVPKISLNELKGDEGWVDKKPVARGLAGRPMDITPAVDGAKRAHIECPEVNVDSLAYWNDPQGTRDREFVTPFKKSDDDSKERYITFSPDRGGWNNVRMSMEIIFVIAAATGRTLVLPPKEPLYLLNKNKPGTEKHRGFADFFPLQTDEFKKRVKTISMVDFLNKEAMTEDGVVGTIPEDVREKVLGAADHCDHRAKSSAACVPIYSFLESVGHVPNVTSSKSCLVFDKDTYEGKTPPQDVQDYVKQTCDKRRVVYWEGSLKDAPFIHFKASHRDTRLLTHFYAMIHFTDPAIDNYYKRFVRDFLHYHDSIFCAAGKIIKAVQKEGVERGFDIDENGGGGYSSLHVRRGDLQYKKVKIAAKEWYENTKEVWKPKEILYVATDERDKTFFDDLAEQYELRFLDDYWDYAELGKLDGNYMGMIDTIVASRGRAFAGTWFSTFTGFINRMRGYHGMSMLDSWYSFLPKKEAVHKWEQVEGGLYAYEWPDGWIGIDSDQWPNRNEEKY